jgi:hypothetical protein
MAHEREGHRYAAQVCRPQEKRLDCGSAEHFGPVPKSAVSNRSERCYSITSAARARSVGGMVMPTDLAVLRFMTRS